MAWETRKKSFLKFNSVEHGRYIFLTGQASLKMEMKLK